MKFLVSVIVMTLSLGVSSLSAQVAVAHPPGVLPQVPTITFCDMVKNPESYFDKPVRITAMFAPATEGQYLRDERCVQSHDEQIGVGNMMISEKESELRQASLRKVRAIEYGGRANVTVVGLLRNVSRRDFVSYHYRFDIVRFEEIEHVVVPYEGFLQSGMTYVGSVRGDKNTVPALVTPVRMPFHYTVRVEWTNLTEFSALRRLAGERRIVFSVVADRIQQMSERRWNRTIRCKLINVRSED